MDKSGPWPSAEHLIIDRPERQPPLQRAAYGALTFAFWAVWVSLWLPLVTFLGWVFGVDRFIDVMLIQDGWNSLLALLKLYGTAIVVCAGTLVLWAAYNWVRFRNSTRRSGPQFPLRLHEIARRTGAPPEMVMEWQCARRLRVLFGAGGRYTRVVVEAPRKSGARDHPPPAAERPRLPARV